MSVNWDSIKYIFQIPLKWYKSISDRVFNAYGSNFIVVKEGYYGGMEIGINDDIFANDVEQHLSGVVKSVDGQTPDGQGNVALGAVKSVNDESPDSNGNVDLDCVMSVNGNLPDSDGDVDLDCVMSVNNTQPDANGNVTITIPQSVVQSVDHHSPDQTGNIQLNAICTINGHNGDSVGAFTGVVQSVDGNAPDANGAVTLSGFVKSVESNTPDANGDVTLSGMVKSVDGHSPDADGAVSFGLTGSKFCRTTSDGHISTTSANVIYLPNGTTALPQGQFSVVTGVTWNGTQLVVTHRNFVFENGVLKTANTQADTKIETVAYTPS